MDRNSVDCDQVQAGLSARLDGEPTGVDPVDLEAHLAVCPSCREFAAALERPGPGRVIGTAQSEVPDLTTRVVDRAGAVDRSGVWWVLRALLFAVALGYLVTAVPELLLSVDPHHGHLAHHLGAFEAAYAVALIFVAVRPAKARAMVPFTAALALGMVVMAFVDIARGEAFPLSEMSHLLEIVGLVIVWLLATRRGWPGHAGNAGRPGTVADDGPTNEASRPPLSVVRDGEGPRQRAS
jgi:predicted anti-sigma-YlaC factor YlaD